MALLAERLSSYLERPVIDGTGLQGSFEFKFALPKEDPAPDLISTIFSSVQGLGLKLEAGKGPVETLVIESVERPKGN